MTLAVTEKAEYGRYRPLGPHGLSAAGSAIALRSEPAAVPVIAREMKPAIRSRVLRVLAACYETACIFLAQPYVRISLLVGPLAVVGYYLACWVYGLVTALTLYVSRPDPLVESLTRL